jgi:carboxypeptidase Taq
MENTIKDFMNYVKQIKNYHEAVSTLSWDLRTGAPRKGVEQRSEVIGTLSQEAFKMSISKQMEEFLDRLTATDQHGLDPIVQATVRECKKEFDRSKKIPAELFKEYVILTSKAESVWEEAREKSDFPMFKPYLEKIVSLTKEFISYWGFNGVRYNTLLDMYEPGITVDQLDQIFTQIRKSTVPLVAAIARAPHQPDTSFLTKEYPSLKQREFSLFILQEMGYDFSAGRLDESVHPFATGLNPGDVRITTRFNPHDFRTAIFGSIHEGGHALYEQNIDPKYIGTPLCEGTSMGIHESQSRFWENIVGRSRSFWNRYYPNLTEYFPKQLNGISLDTFYRAVNHVEPSLIRVEADELTYNLHIMIRYELEKGLFDGGLEVADLPQVWNDKMRDYLGVVPTNDADGVLQDVHWAGGSFGYFPSYSLGNVYAAQFNHCIRKALPEFDQYVESGNLLPIKNWLTELIYQYGKSLEPMDILRKVTGEEINPTYLTAYLEEKYNSIYNLS